MEFQEKTSGSAIINFDKLKAVKGVSNKSPINIKMAMNNNADIMMDIKDILKQLKITTTMSWVKGHYEGTEDHIKYKLNQIAHNAPVSFLKTLPRGYVQLQTQLRPVSHRVSMNHNNKLITSGLKSLVNRTYYFPPHGSKAEKG